MPTEEISVAPEIESELAIVALIGNPNSGKTTLFNALTGMRQKIANYPGVTVEKKIGVFMTQHGREAQMIDLPGTYSLTPQSPDEAVTRDVLLGVLPDTPRPDRVVCVVDAANLERNLYLACQVIELGLPTIIALNMFDLASANGDTIDVDELSHRLGVPVIPCSANSRAGIADLRIALSAPAISPPDWKVPLPPLVDQSLETIRGELPPNQDLSFAQIRAMLILLLSDERAEKIVVGLGWEHMLHRFRQARASLLEKLPTWQEDAISARYDHIGEICQDVLRRGADAADAPVSFTDRVDAVLIHPVWGWLIFLSIMALMFTSIFTFANYPMDGPRLFAVAGDWVKGALAPGDLRSLITDGVIKGVGGVVVFLPQILILFLFIGLLEDSGYMARAAFIMDRVMSGVGLHGKSFIPLEAPALAPSRGWWPRADDRKSGRTDWRPFPIAPFASCFGAAPGVALMIATVFPADNVPAWEKAGILMGMYALGTLTAFAFAWLFKRTILRGKPMPLVLELPPYRRPSLRTVAHGCGSATLSIRRAGVTNLGLTSSFGLSRISEIGNDKPEDQLAQSYAGRMGKSWSRALEPLGSNWKIGIGLIGAQAAREVFVSTVAVVYSVGGSDDNAEVETDSVRKALLEDRWPDGRMVFTPLVCLTIMIYFVFSMQCISTLTVV